MFLLTSGATCVYIVFYLSVFLLNAEGFNLSFFLKKKNLKKMATSYICMCSVLFDDATHSCV